MRSTWFLRPLPDLIVLGAMKAGSTSLYEMLVSHPDVRGAVRKEVHFLDQHYDRGLRWYRGQFSAARPGGGRIAVDATPMYLSLPAAPVRLASSGVRPRFVVVLRDPVERAISHWKHRHREGRDTRSLDQVIEDETGITDEQAAAMPDEHYKRLVLAHGHYADQLGRWFHEFPQDDFFIVESQRLFGSPQAVMGEVFNFAGLSSWRVSDLSPRNVGDARPAAQPMIAALSDYYEQRNERVYQLLGERYRWT